MQSYLPFCKKQRTLASCGELQYHFNLRSAELTSHRSFPNMFFENGQCLLSDKREILLRKNSRTCRLSRRFSGTTHWWRGCNKGQGTGNSVGFIS
jgi:hypothetical protein